MAKTKNDKTQMKKDSKHLVISRVISAPKETVFRAWTDPKMAKKWWGPKGFSAPSIKIDLKIGGKYIFAMRGPKGSQWDKDMYSAGVYKEIVPHKKLVVTDYFSDERGNKIKPADYGMDPNFPEECTVTVKFDEEKGKTKLSIIYDLPASPAAKTAILKSGMNEGWNSSLDKLQAAIEG